MEPREAEGSLAYAHTAPLHAPAGGAAEPAQVIAPVLLRPDLVPVDEEQVAPERARRGRGEQREVRERGRVQDFVASSVPEQVREDAEPEDERRQNPPPRPGVQLHPRPDRYNVDAGDVWLLAAWPLAHCQIRDVVAGGGQPLGKRSVPPLGAPDSVRVEAVVDDADTHGRRQIRRSASL